MDNPRSELMSSELLGAGVLPNKHCQITSKFGCSSKLELDKDEKWPPGWAVKSKNGRNLKKCTNQNTPLSKTTIYELWYYCAKCLSEFTGSILCNRCCSSFNKYAHTPWQTVRVSLPSPRHRCKTLYKEQSVNKPVLSQQAKIKGSAQGFKAALGLFGSLLTQLQTPPSAHITQRKEVCMEACI